MSETDPLSVASLRPAGGRSTGLVPVGEGSILGPAARQRAMVVLCAGVFMASLDLFIVNMAFPTIAKDFKGTSLAELSWILNAYTIVFAALLVPAGRWADRVGRRRIFVAGLALFTVGSVLCGLAPGVGLLIAARVVQATGGAMLTPASLSIILAIVPETGRAKAIATWAAVGAMAAALGPLAGGALVEASWRWVFFVNLPLGVAALAFSHRTVPESRDSSSAAMPDLVGAGLLTVAISALALGLVEGPSWGWGSGRVVGLFVAAPILLTGFIARSARHRAPVIELPILAVRSFAGAFFASLFFYGAFGAFVLSTIEFLMVVWGYSPLRVGLAFTPGPLMVLPFARFVAPSLAARVGGPGRVAALGSVVWGSAWLWWLLVMPAHPAYLSHLLPEQLLAGAGIGLAIPSLMTAATIALPPARFGAGSGVINMARQIGAVIGSAAFVAILVGLDPHSPLPTFRAGVLLVIGFLVAAAIAALVIGRLHSPAQQPRLRSVEDAEAILLEFQP
ncbi:MAG: MFS transporter [Acidimicrobiales bacterium]